MKKHCWLAVLIGLMLTLGFVCSAPAENLLPEEIQETIGDLTVVKTVYWDSPESTWFVLARTPYEANILLCFVQEDNSWVRSFHTVAAVPQGENAVKLLYITKAVQDFINNRTTPGPILIILDRDGNYTSYQRSDSGQWNLLYVFWHDEQVYLEYSDDSVTFRTPADREGHRQSVTVQGTFERDIRNVDINTIPRSPQQAQEKSDTEPADGQAEEMKE